VGLAGSACVFLIYKFAGLWTADQRARLLASAFYAILPAIIMYFPEFDQAYPIFSMLLILFWVRALDACQRWLWYAISFGAVLFLASFFVYQILTIGAFMLLYGLYWLWREGRNRTAWSKLFCVSGVALGVTVGLYSLLWAVTGYNAPAAFVHAKMHADQVYEVFHISYTDFLVYNFYEFALGSGVIAVPIVVLHAFRGFGRSNPNRASLPLTLIGLGAIVAIDLTGLIRNEVDRAWLFLQPLMVVPLALELARLSRTWRFAIFTIQWWIMVCLKTKISCLEP
jgi:hypothetical protein